MTYPISRAFPILALAVLVFAAPAAADSTHPSPDSYPDWEALADVEVIEVLTHDEDGDRRESKVWFVRMEGEVYLRTSESAWLENLRRDPNLGLRIWDVEYQARDLEVDTDELIEKVGVASRQKCGWQDAIIHPFRMREPDILRVVPREHAG